MAKIDVCEFPIYEEMGKKVAEKALDEILYDGKSIREWMQIIASEDAISRQAAIDAANKVIERDTSGNNDVVNAMIAWSEYIRHLPSAQPDVPDTNVGDMISRQAVLDLVVANHTELNGVNVVMYSPLYKDIKQLPFVNPQEPKTGHWRHYKKVKGFSSAYPNVCNLKIFPNTDKTWITIQDDVGTSITIKLSDIELAISIIKTESEDNHGRYRVSN